MSAKRRQLLLPSCINMQKHVRLEQVRNVGILPFNLQQKKVYLSYEVGNIVKDQIIFKV